MKKAFLLFFLSIFLFNTTGYYFLFLSFDSANRQNVRSSISTEKELVVLRFHKSFFTSIDFKDDGKEILQNGEMYDIKSKSTDGDYIVFYCKHDNKETHLLTGLANNVLYNVDQKSPEKKQNNIIKTPVKDLFFCQNTTHINASTAVVYSTSNCHLTSHIPPTLPLPPPEAATV